MKILLWVIRILIILMLVTLLLIDANNHKLWSVVIDGSLIIMWVAYLVYINSVEKTREREG